MSDSALFDYVDYARLQLRSQIQTIPGILNGERAVMVSIIKLGGASTVEIVDQVMARLPEIRASAPPGMRIEPVFDQSIFVHAAMASVLIEAVIGALLVASVVLAFLASWRSTLIVLTSIPLALLASIIGLYLTGHTLNLMTLGGLALAIGILVDNALVEIENINRSLDAGLELREAILAGARQVFFPELVSTMAVCIVFTPVFLLTGVSACVFQPLALAVVFAMAASFLLSRTLVPTLASMMLEGEAGARHALGRTDHPEPPGALQRLRHGYAGLLGRLLQRKVPISVPALMGMTLVVGVSTANTVLVTSFARDRLAAGNPAPEAAVTAAATRLRPVLMTALAMVVGTLPMALGLGEGGEQNAPLGRAVVGGLIAGTAATLLPVPLAFAVATGLRGGPTRAQTGGRDRTPAVAAG